MRPDGGDPAEAFRVAAPALPGYTLSMIGFQDDFLMLTMDDEDIKAVQFPRNTDRGRFKTIGG